MQNYLTIFIIMIRITRIKTARKNPNNKILIVESSEASVDKL